MVARLETPATPGFRDLAADLASRDFGASLVRVPPPRGFARDDVFVLPRRMPLPALTRFACAGVTFFALRGFLGVLAIP